MDLLGPLDNGEDGVVWFNPDRNQDNSEIFDQATSRLHDTSSEPVTVAMPPPPPPAVANDNAVSLPPVGNHPSTDSDFSTNTSCSSKGILADSEDSEIYFKFPKPGGEYIASHDSAAGPSSSYGQGSGSEYARFDVSPDGAHQHHLGDEPDTMDDEHHEAVDEHMNAEDSVEEARNDEEAEFLHVIEPEHRNDRRADDNVDEVVNEEPRNNVESAAQESLRPNGRDSEQNMDDVINEEPHENAEPDLIHVIEPVQPIRHRDGGLVEPEAVQLHENFGIHDLQRYMRHLDRHQGRHLERHLDRHQGRHLERHRFDAERHENDGMGPGPADPQVVSLEDDMEESEERPVEGDGGHVGEDANQLADVAEAAATSEDSGFVEGGQQSPDDGFAEDAQALAVLGQPGFAVGANFVENEDINDQSRNELMEAEPEAADPGAAAAAAAVAAAEAEPDVPQRDPAAPQPEAEAVVAAPEPAQDEHDAAEHQAHIALHFEPHEDEAHEEGEEPGDAVGQLMEQPELQNVLNILMDYLDRNDLNLGNLVGHVDVDEYLPLIEHQEEREQVDDDPDGAEDEAADAEAPGNGNAELQFWLVEEEREPVPERQGNQELLVFLPNGFAEAMDADQDNDDGNHGAAAAQRRVVVLDNNHDVARDADNQDNDGAQGFAALRQFIEQQRLLQDRDLQPGAAADAGELTSLPSKCDVFFSVQGFIHRQGCVRFLTLATKF